MADETEIERLVVRLVGVNSDIDKMLEGLRTELNSLATETKKNDTEFKELERTMKRGEEVTRQFETATDKFNRTAEELNHLLDKDAISLETFGEAANKAFKDLKNADEGLNYLANLSEKAGKSLSLYVTAPLAAMGAAAVYEFDQADNASRKLDAALESNGRAVESVGAEYRKFAAEIQKKTKTQDDDVVSLLQQAESLGVTGEAAKRAAQNAIALGAAKGMAAESALRMTVALESGNAALLQRHLPALKAIKDPTEKAAKAQELLGKMFSVAEAEAKTFSGQMTQLKNETGDFLEDIGKVISGGLTPYIASVRELVSWLQSLSPEMKTSLVILGATAAAIGPLLLGFGSLAHQINSLTILYNTMSVAQMTAIGAMGAFAIALVGIGAGAYYLYTMNADVQALNASLKESVDLSNKLGSAKSDSVTKTIETGQGLATPGQKRDFFGEELKTAEQSVEQVSKRLQDAKNALQQLTEAGIDWNKKGGWGEHVQKTQQLKENIESDEAALKMATEAAGRFKAELEAVSEVKINEKHQKEVEKFIHSLEMKVKHHGESANAMHYEELALKGLTEVQEAHIQTLLLQEKAQKAADVAAKEATATAKKAEADVKHHQNAIDNLTASLKSQVETFGQTSALKQVAQMKNKGFTDAELQEAERLAKELDKLESKKKLTDQGKQFTEKHMSKDDKLKRDQDEAKRLFDAGVISAETYTNSLKDMDKQLSKPHKINFEKLEATDIRSSDALAKIMELQISRMGDMPGKKRGKQKSSDSDQMKLSDGLVTGFATSMTSQTEANMQPVDNASATIPKETGLESLLEPLNRLVSLAEQQANKPVLALVDADLGGN